MDAEIPKTSPRQRIVRGYRTLLKEIKDFSLRFYNPLNELFTQKRYKSLLGENNELTKENSAYKGRLGHHKEVILKQRKKIEGTEERAKQSRLEFITLQKEHDSLKQTHSLLQEDNSSLQIEYDACERLLTQTQGQVLEAQNLLKRQRASKAKISRDCIISILRDMPEEATSISGLIDSNNLLLAASPSFYRLSGYKEGERLDCNEIIGRKNQGFLTFSEEQPWDRITLKTTDGEKTLSGYFLPSYVGTTGRGSRLNFTYFYLEPQEGAIKRAYKKVFGKKTTRTKEKIPQKIQDIILESNATLNPATG